MAKYFVPYRTIENIGINIKFGVKFLAAVHRNINTICKYFGLTAPLRASVCSITHGQSATNNCRCVSLKTNAYKHLIDVKQLAIWYINIYNFFQWTNDVATLT